MVPSVEAALSTLPFIEIIHADVIKGNGEDEQDAEVVTFRVAKTGAKTWPPFLKALLTRAAEEGVPFGVEPRKVYSLSDSGSVVYQWSIVAWGDLEAAKDCVFSLAKNTVMARTPPRTAVAKPTVRRRL